MPQATVSFPFNVIMPYNPGDSYKDIQFESPFLYDSPNVTFQAVALQMGYPPDPTCPTLIPLPSQQAGSSNATIQVGVNYSNGTIAWTVRATPDPSVAGSTTNVIIVNWLTVTYQYSVPADSVYPNASIVLWSPGYSFQFPVQVRDSPQHAYFGHNPSTAGQVVYPSLSNFAASVVLGTPKVPMGDTGDVLLLVSGNGNPTCVSVYVEVKVNQTQ